MRNLLLIIAGLLILSSCNVERRIARRCERLQALCPAQIEYKIDSVTIIREKLRDTTIMAYIPVDSASIMAMVICDEKGNAQLNKRVYESGRQILQVEIKDGILKADCGSKVDSLEFRLFMKDRVIETMKKETKVRKIISYKTRVIDYVCRTICGILIILLIILLLLYFKRLFKYPRNTFQ